MDYPVPFVALFIGAILGHFSARALDGHRRKKRMDGLLLSVRLEADQNHFLLRRIPFSQMEFSYIPISSSAVLPRNELCRSLLKAWELLEFVSIPTLNSLNDYVDLVDKFCAGWRNYHEHSFAGPKEEAVFEGADKTPRGTDVEEIEENLHLLRDELIKKSDGLSDNIEKLRAKIRRLWCFNLLMDIANWLKKTIRHRFR